ncbi:hypothetical protein PoB_005646500 [Plakobranchus ocellatus]|uniref:Uncharacterized protein n=1 Tax=Plakobranchus ocellatus TaxID=259542 RepID=A0AAV4CE40_9GAST|nr:hypothetical protein PoB_005646500 [Plakobranchus ocellatus]
MFISCFCSHTLAHRGYPHGETDPLLQLTDLKIRLGYTLSAVARVKKEMRQSGETITTSTLRSSRKHSEMSKKLPSYDEFSTITESDTSRTGTLTFSQQSCRSSRRMTTGQAFHFMNTTSNNEGTQRHTENLSGELGCLTSRQAPKPSLISCESDSKLQELRERTASSGAVAACDRASCESRFPLITSPRTDRSVSGGDTGREMEGSIKKKTCTQSRSNADEENGTVGHERITPTDKCAAKRKLSNLALPGLSNVLCNTSQDKSSNKSITADVTLPSENFQQEDAQNFRTDVATNKLNSEKRSSLLKYFIESPDSNLCHSSYKSNRMLNQKAKEELVCIVKAGHPPESADTCVGVWEDGVYSGPLDVEVRGSNKKTSRCGRSLPTTRSGEISKMPRLHSAKLRPFEATGGKIHGEQNPLSSGFSNPAPKNISVLSRNVSRKVFGSTLRNLGSVEAMGKNSQERKADDCRSLTKRRSICSLGRRAYVHGSRDTPALKKFLSCNDVTRTDAAAEVKSYRNPIRCPKIPLRGKTVVASSFSNRPAPLSLISTGAQSGTASSAPTAATATPRLWRNRSRDRDLKKNCLAILANVQLRSCRSEERNPEDFSP